MVRKIKQNSGFTLIEVMIALAIFAVFIVSFISAQGYNVLDSSRIRKEIQLKELAQFKINEIITTPPEFKESLTLKPETGKFEDHEQFKFEVAYKKFLIPDYAKLTGQNDEDSSDSNPIQKKIFENVKKNMEEMIWQVEVTVINSENDDRYSVSTWLYNHKVPVKLDTF